MTDNHRLQAQVGRRAFLQNGVLLLTAPKLIPALTSVASAFADEPPTTTRVGLITDLHYDPSRLSGR